MPTYVPEVDIQGLAGEVINGLDRHEADWACAQYFQETHGIWQNISKEVCY